MSGAVIVDQGVLDGESIIAVSYLEPIADWDSGFAVFGQSPGAIDGHDSALVCLGCFLGDYPDVRRGMELARQQGDAIYDGNEWI